MTETIDAAELAALLGCRPEQIEDEARLGNIPGLKIGRGWKFMRADTLDFLAERARAEALDRRSKRAPIPNVRQIKPKRQAAPALPNSR